MCNNETMKRCIDIKCVLVVDGELIRRPQSLIVKTGEELELMCITSLENIPVNWIHTTPGSGNEGNIFASGAIVDLYQEKFHIKSQLFGEYTLVLKNAQLEDGGTYTCEDNAGLGPDRASADVIVLGSYYILYSAA